jgi:hypothetical protein
MNILADTPAPEGETQIETAAPPASDIPSNPPADPANIVADPTNHKPSILDELYGDLAGKIEFPEGLEEDVKTSPSMKPFVGKDGKINYAALAKSYVHTKRAVGSKISVPGENATEAEWDNYFENVGWVKDASKYEIKVPEGMQVTEEAVGALKKAIHESRIPQAQGQKLFESLTKFSQASVEDSVKKMNEQIQQGIDGLRQEWGQAFDKKVHMAKKVVESFGDPSVKELFKNDVTLGSNPVLLKFLNNIGQKFYGEDSIPGKTLSDAPLSPAEASAEINRILGDDQDAYHKPEHPSYRDRVSHMQKLFNYKSGIR